MSGQERLWIRTYPDPVLRIAAQPVDPACPALPDTISQMFSLLRESGGVGLAGPQVGLDWRIFIPRFTNDENEDEPADERVYINPSIALDRGGQPLVRSEEGCLSIPGYKGYIKRSVWVRFRAMDHTSKLVKLKADGILSQVLEHEVDHLNGILYTDHLESHQTLMPVETQGPDGETESEEEAAPPTSGSRLDHQEASEVFVAPRPAGEETPASLKVR